MSVIKVNNITNRDGTSGPVIAGITTVSSTSHMVVPTGRTGQRYVDDGENIVRSGLVLYLDAKHSYPSRTGIGTTTSGAAATPGSSLDGDPYTWYDMSGYENNGQLNNQVGYSTANGGSLLFDGINDFVDLGNPPSLDITESITHILWLYPVSNFSSSYNVIFGKGRNPDPGGGSQTHTLIYTDPLSFYIVQYGKNDGNAGLGVTNAVTYNQWVCYASTYDGSNVILYKNGSEVSRAAQTGSIYNTNQTRVRIGSDPRYNLDSGRQYNGRVAQVQIYNRALTAAEVLQNYNALKGRFGL